MSITFEHNRVRPDPDDRRPTEVDLTGARIETKVSVERPLVGFLNGQEIVTAMTIDDYPEDLAVNYLLNQGMLRPDDVIAGKRFLTLVCPKRVKFDQSLDHAAEETARHHRKSANDDG